ncbi:hypothetical protein [Oryza sativa Japonica Group]|uniref:Uncharacterized protein n=1 Tax=Oryza sativa subsp. japonica TaxID=39947 RepID=Q5VQR9_ORYSJ|nr:hypothetical protein [Oryza sativa Japonica Group]
MTDRPTLDADIYGCTYFGTELPHRIPSADAEPLIATATAFLSSQSPNHDTAADDDGDEFEEEEDAPHLRRLPPVFAGGVERGDGWRSTQAAE